MLCDDHAPTMPHVDETDITHDENGRHIVHYECGLCGAVWTVESDCGQCWRE
ncbi:MAG: hypothetical protein QME66_08195 [Candidatus Eisenbacteria bacterium]|nr:hypothetical protein [Candidatus Eisenbacteria bacterium]